VKHSSLKRYRYPVRLIGLMALRRRCRLYNSPPNARSHTAITIRGGRFKATTLSRDGKVLAYALFPQEGDGQIVVRNLATVRNCVRTRARRLLRAKAQIPRGVPGIRRRPAQVCGSRLRTTTALS
jgi:hypothetical protein